MSLMQHDCQRLSDVEVLEQELDCARQIRQNLEAQLKAKELELAALNAETLKQSTLNKTNMRFLNAVLDQMPVGLCLTHLSGEIKMTNPVAREMLALPAKPARQFNMSEFFPALAINAMQAGRPFQSDLRRSDGNMVPAEIIISPLFQGTSNSLIWLLTDIVERRAAEDKQHRLEADLRQAQKMESLGVLSAGIAHEINTPLQFASDNVSFITQTLTQFQQMLDVIKRADTSNAWAEMWAEHDADFLLLETPKALADTSQGLQKVAEIVRAIKEFAHPSGGKFQENDFNKIVENAVTVTRNTWKYVADVETDLAPDLPLVNCCGGEIGQVLFNLITNASDAFGDIGSGRKGKISISTRALENRVELTVADNGPGIPPEIVSRIFDPFFTTKAPGKGSGQGLAICHTIITRGHNGRISVRQNEPTGALFRISLPFHGSPSAVQR